jgi:hypothetical protein
MTVVDVWVTNGFLNWFSEKSVHYTWVNCRRTESVFHLSHRFFVRCEFLPAAWCIVIARTFQQLSWSSNPRRVQEKTDLIIYIYRLPEIETWNTGIYKIGKGHVFVWIVLHMLFACLLKICSWVGQKISLQCVYLGFSLHCNKNSSCIIVVSPLCLST